jgi:surface antigen
MKNRYRVAVLGMLLAGLIIGIFVGGCNKDHRESPVTPEVSQLPDTSQIQSELNAVAVSSCAGYTSSGNPYPCCTNGNCTWWSWKMAKDNWGISLPSWGNAQSWATNAQNAGYTVSSSPAAGTIAVNTTASVGGVVYGHVAWVTGVSGSTITVTEMGCDSWNGVRTNTYYSSYFNGGFIYPPGSGTTVIVDDLSSGFTRYGTASYWQTASIGYNGHMYWTYSNGSVRDNYAKWTPSLPSAGTYTVSVYIPNNNATSNATYTIYANGTTYTRTVNQNNYYDAWVSLGSFYFAASGGYVLLGDNTGETAGSTKVGFDAVKWSK